MTTFLLRRLWLISLTIAVFAGCSDPAPTAVKTGPPPPPPAPAPEPKPAPPPPKPQPDPLEIVVKEIGAALQRFGALGAEIRDEATADKAVAEMSRLSARLKELAAEMAKIPYRPGEEKQMLTLRTDLARMTTQISTPQSALADPELQLKVLPAQLSFVSEGLMSIEQAVLSRQPSAPQPQASAVPAAPTPESQPKP